MSDDPPRVVPDISELDLDAAKPAWSAVWRPYMGRHELPARRLIERREP
jgi:hypothetical protein